MEIMKVLIDTVYQILTIEIHLIGYSISLWHVFVFTALLSLVVYMMFRIFN